MPFTQEQNKAIQTRDAELLVAAAAGSGKTAVLVERILSLISDKVQPVDIDSLLVVTFTNAAAAEMKTRIGDSLRKKLEQSPNDLLLQKQIALLPRADIMTIHGFCQKILRQNAFLLQLDPHFRIAEDTEIKLIKQEILDHVMEQWYQRKLDAFQNAIDIFGSNSSDQGFRELILELHSFVLSNPFPERWLHEASTQYSAKDLDHCLWAASAKKEIALTLRGLLPYGQLAIDLSEGVPEYLPALQQDMQQLLHLIEQAEAPETNNFCQLYQSFFALSFLTLARKKKETDPLLAEKVKDLREVVKKGISDLKETFFFQQPEKILEEIQSMHPIIHILSEVCLSFMHSFQAEKQEKRLVDFNDLEHFCLRILLAPESTESAPVPTEQALALQAQYQHILIDEYQDSNMVQEMILTAIAGSRNRFMVGDVKQSIYRFRQAQPELFIQKYETFQKGIGDKQRIDLSKNFRSRAEVLSCINYLFYALMTKDLGEISYDSDSALYAGADYPALPPNHPCGAELILIPIEEEDAFADGSLEELTKEEYEAVAVTQKIQEILANSDLVTDKETGELRPANFGDIVVLLRAPSRWSQIYIDSLLQHNIPASAESSSGFFGTSEVSTIVSYLQLIDNPMQDIPLISVLHSQIYQLTGEELGSIRCLKKDCHFYECLSIASADVLQQATMDKLRRFLSDFTYLREQSLFLSLHPFLWEIYYRTGYYSYLGITPGGTIRQANLRYLANQSMQFEQTSMSGLYRFIQYLEKIKQNRHDLGEAKVLGEEENFVRIMSIHKSKGLEFPIVIIAGLGKQFNKRDLNKPFVLHSRLGIGSIYADIKNRIQLPSFSRNTIQSQIKREMLSEEMRTLYVALTRAKERLIFVGTVKNLEKQREQWSIFLQHPERALPEHSRLHASCYLDWICPAIARHRDGGPLRTESCSGIFDDTSLFKVKLLCAKSLPALTPVLANKNILQEIQGWDTDRDHSKKRELIFQHLNWAYPHSDQTALPASISISEMKRLLYAQRLPVAQPLASDITLELPAFMQERKGLSPSERGTVVHTILEQISFSITPEEAAVRTFIEERIQQGILTQEEGAAVDVKEITVFLRSPLCQRIRDAGKVWRETPFVLLISPETLYPCQPDTEGILIHGIIDCFFLEGEEIVVLDYKTGRQPSSSQTMEQYRYQLSIYAHAIQSLTGLPVKEKHLYFLGSGQQLQVSD